jgi:hypothetical protein
MSIPQAFLRWPVAPNSTICGFAIVKLRVRRANRETISELNRDPHA